MARRKKPSHKFGLGGGHIGQCYRSPVTGLFRKRYVKKLFKNAAKANEFINIGQSWPPYIEKKNSSSLVIFFIFFITPMFVIMTFYFFFAILIENEYWQSL